MSVDEPTTLPEIVEPTALEAITRGEVDIQITTARRYPRSLKKFKQNARTLALCDEETAASCYYVMLRGGKAIEGESVRLAEIIVATYGNLRAGSRVIHEGDRFIVAEGVCWDLENNVAMKSEVRRRITDKHGRKYSDDMVAVTANAACAIAFRNAVFKVVPKATVRDIYQDCKRVAMGDIKTLASRRTALLVWAQSAGVTEQQVLAVVERESVEEVDLEDLSKLRGLATSVRDGEVDINTAFPEIKTAPKEGKQKFGKKKQVEKKGKNKPVDPLAAALEEITKADTLDRLGYAGGVIEQLSGEGKAEAALAYEKRKEELSK